MSLEEQPILWRILPADKAAELDALNAQSHPNRVTPKQGADGVLYIPEGVVGSNPFELQSDFLKDLQPVYENPEWPVTSDEL